jgi:hypothetical protein
MPITLNHDGDIAITNGNITVDGNPIGGGGSGALVGTNYIYVAANGTDTDNATELQAAYDAAKLLTLTATNRITIVAGPGYYNFGLTNFTMDTQYIDLVSLDGNRSIVFNSTDPAGTLNVTANDVFVNGVDVSPSNKGFNIANSLSLLRVENCKGGDYSFGGSGGTSSGTFTNCNAGDYSFGGSGGTSSGTFTNCNAGGYSFGSFLGTASGTFTNCTGGTNSFGSNSSIASGTFTNCTGGAESFGYNDTASGIFRDCTGGNGSFGGNDGTASGTFTMCVGGIDSFAGGTSGTLTGKLFYCRLTSGTFQTVSSGGRTYYCVDGTGTPNNQ